MRYGDTHKAETHAKLVRLAGRVLREKGPQNLAVAELMQAAGLTHGGFYAHFKSKDALLVEALESVFEESHQNFQRVTDGLPPRRALARYIDTYVAPAHRDSRSAAGAVSRTVSDKRLSDELLAAARASIKARLGLCEVGCEGGAAR